MENRVRVMAVIHVLPKIFVIILSRSIKEGAGRPRQAGAVIVTLDRVPAIPVEDFGDAVALVGAVFQQQRAALCDNAAAIAGDRLDRFETARSRRQSNFRFGPETPQVRVAISDVGRIRNDDVKVLPGNGRRPVAFEKGDIADLMLTRILPGHGERSRADIGCCDGARSCAIASAIAPLPVPRSSTLAVDRRGMHRNARSTSSSVSGLGTRVAGLTISSSDQNSLVPLMYAIGSPDNRRVTVLCKRSIAASSRTSSGCEYR
jgi:hypothetical protein